jgi:hypothetical protein
MQSPDAPSQNQGVYGTDGQGVRTAAAGFFPKLAKKVFLIATNLLGKSLV